MKKIITNIAVIGSMFLINNVSYASSVNGTTKATASLTGSCILSMSNVSFGTYIPSNGDVFSSAIIKTTCSKGLTYSIQNDSQGLNIEQNNNKYAFPPTGSRWSRYMLDVGNNRLYYNLFLDSQYSMVWGGDNSYGNISGYSGKVQIYLTGTGEEQASSIYGAMSGGQYVPPGAYSSTLPVVVVF